VLGFGAKTKQAAASAKDSVVATASTAGQSITTTSSGRIGPSVLFCYGMFYF